MSMSARHNFDINLGSCTEHLYVASYVLSGFLRHQIVAMVSDVKVLDAYHTDKAKPRISAIKNSPLVPSWPGLVPITLDE